MLSITKQMVEIELVLINLYNNDVSWHKSHHHLFHNIKNLSPGVSYFFDTSLDNTQRHVHHIFS